MFRCRAKARRYGLRGVAAQVIGARGVERDEEGVGFARGSRLRLSALTAGREEEQAQAKAPAYTATQLRLGSQQSLSRPPHTQVIVYTIDRRQRMRLFGSPPEQKRPRRARASHVRNSGARPPGSAAVRSSDR